MTVEALGLGGIRLLVLGASLGVVLARNLFHSVLWLALALVGTAGLFVLLHAGRGGGLSDMFGGGQLGGSMAGSTVVERNLDRITIVTALIFVFTTILLSLRLG